jgi:hypothetical protein
MFPSGPFLLPRPAGSFGQIDTDWLTRGHDDVSGEITFDPTGVEPLGGMGELISLNRLAKPGHRLAPAC